MTDYSKITALYSRLSVGDEDRDKGINTIYPKETADAKTYSREVCIECRENTIRWRCALCQSQNGI